MACAFPAALRSSSMVIIDLSLSRKVNEPRRRTDLIEELLLAQAKVNHPGG
jgi:hypothetical protein